MARSTLSASMIGFMLLLLALVPAMAGAETASDPGAALIDAAQREDVARVKALLAAGTPVDAANRYGATALFYATDKGNLELAKLLIEAGANVNVQDTFYSASPLGWALFSISEETQHREIVLLLLANGAEQADAALSAAVRMDDAEMLRAALATDKASLEARRGALAAAERDDKASMVAVLAEGLPPEEPAEVAEASPTPSLTAEDRARYVGEFANGDLDMKIKVFVEGDVLKAQAGGQPALTLVPTGEDTFTAQEQDGIDLTFSGRGGIVERFELAQGGQQFMFARAEPEAGDRTAEEVAAPLPTAKRGPAIQWSSFRGPAASGIGDGQGVPSAWDGEAGTNIRWKTPIPGIALSSPVIWEQHVFIATATSENGDDTFRTGLYGDVDSVDDESTHVWKVYALDKATGKVLWQREASRGTPKVKRHLKSSHVNSTPVTDGKRLVVLFPSEGLFCYDFDGKLLWQQDLGVLGSGWFFDPTYEWGFASSPIIHDGRVIVQVDIYSGSFIGAWDLETGKLAWRTERDEIPTWSTPNILPSSKPGGPAEIVTNGTTIRGYDATTGAELWTLAPNSEIVVGTPVIANGLAFVTGGYPPARPIYAIRPGGRGDLSLADGEEKSEKIAWRVERGGTYIPTPVVYEGILYMLHNNGRLAAYDAQSGELIYRKRIGNATSFSGSPVVSDGRLFATTEDGATHVVRTGKVYAELETNELGEVVMTTPAISDGLMVIRGMEHVYGIGEAPAGEESPAAGN